MIIIIMNNHNENGSHRMTHTHTTIQPTSRKASTWPPTLNRAGFGSLARLQGSFEERGSVDELGVALRRLLCGAGGAGAGAGAGAGGSRATAGSWHSLANDVLSAEDKSFGYMLVVLCAHRGACVLSGGGLVEGSVGGFVGGLVEGLVEGLVGGLVGRLGSVGRYGRWALWVDVWHTSKSMMLQTK